MRNSGGIGQSAGFPCAHPSSTRGAIVCVGWGVGCGGGLIGVGVHAVSAVRTQAKRTTEIRPFDMYSVSHKCKRETITIGGHSSLDRCDHCVLLPGCTWDPHEERWQANWDACPRHFAVTGMLTRLNSGDQTEFALASYEG